jgi:hypothetical protein
METSCMVCGRRFSLETIEQGGYGEVRYCSQRCHERRLRASDHRLEAAMEHLLATREIQDKGATLDPEEAARFVDRDGWRLLTEAAAMAAGRLAATGRFECLQSGKVVEPSLAEGPILLRRKPPT